MHYSNLLAQGGHFAKKVKDVIETCLDVIQGLKTRVLVASMPSYIIDVAARARIGDKEVVRKIICNKHGYSFNNEPCLTTKSELLRLARGFQTGSESIFYQPHVLQFPAFGICAPGNLSNTALLRKCMGLYFLRFMVWFNAGLHAFGTGKTVVHPGFVLLLSVINYDTDNDCIATGRQWGGIVFKLDPAPKITAVLNFERQFSVNFLYCSRLAFSDEASPEVRLSGFRSAIKFSKSDMVLVK